MNVKGEERLAREEFMECIDLVLSGLATTGPDPSAAHWQPSMELNEGVSTLWVTLQDDGIEGLDAEEERLVVSVYNHFGDLSEPALTDRRGKILDRLRQEARALKDHVHSRASVPHWPADASGISERPSRLGTRSFSSTA